MNDKNRKAMFCKGKKKYVPWQMAKSAFREIAHVEGLKTPADWEKFKKTTKLPSDIPKNPEQVYSKSNIQKNIKHGVDVKKGVYY